MTGLMLDALVVPSPQELVNDCRQVGAVVVGGYWWRPWPGSTWTPEHDAALGAAGIAVLKIVVPGNAPPDPLGILWGLNNAVVAMDLETNSLPPPEWVSRFLYVATQINNLRPIRYGDLNVLAAYPALHGDWVSHGLIPVRAGAIEPIPELPQYPGVVADQYAVEVTVNGHGYDASVINLGIFSIGQEDDMFTDSDRARLGDKVYAFDLGADKTRYVAGPDQNTYFNLVSQGSAGAVTTVRVFAYDPAGSVLGVKDYTTRGNQPNLAGPQQAAGQVAELGATGPGVTLGFVNQGPDDVVVTIH